MIRLNGNLTLPDDLRWDNKFAWYIGTASSERTLGGNLIVWPGSLTKGRPIHLVGTEERGWLTLTQVEALLVLANNPISYLLELGGGTYNVIFHYEDDPCIDVQPLVSSRITFSAGDYFYGTIKFMEV